MPRRWWLFRTPHRAFCFAAIDASLCVLERKVFAQAQHQLAHRGLALEVHVLVLDVAPESPNSGILKRSTRPVHANGDALALKHTGEAFAGEL